MIENDKPAFVAALNELALLKPGAKITTEGYAAWWNAMRDWQLADFRAACARLAKTCEFMPNPFHFEQLRREVQGEPALDAFERARAHARDLPVSGGFLQEAPSGDELLDRVVRQVGGYRYVAGCGERDMSFLRQRFVEAFDAERDRGENAKAVPRITAASGRSLLEGPGAGMRKLLGSAAQ